MSTSIGPTQRLRAAKPPTNHDVPTRGPGWLVRTAQVVTLVASSGGIGAIAVGFDKKDWRIAIAGVVLVFLACMAGSVCAHHALLADRASFYRRGKVDGWYEGWHGKLPDPDDPLLRT